VSQHQQRPRDILEFLRRASTDDEPATEVAEPEVSSPTPHVTVSSGDAPMVVLRRSQVVVAAVAAGLLILLAFLLGLASSGESAEEAAASAPVRFYTIKLTEFSDTRNGKLSAKTLLGELEQEFGEEVTIERLDRDRRLFLALGSWLKNPRENRQAMDLLKKVRKLKAPGHKSPPFQDAYFFSIKR
jgi:hypothetical protein